MIGDGLGQTGNQHIGVADGFHFLDAKRLGQHVVMREQAVQVLDQFTGSKIS